jgi:hypothetical protein
MDTLLANLKEILRSFAFEAREREMRGNTQPDI